MSGVGMMLLGSGPLVPFITVANYTVYDQTNAAPASATYELNLVGGIFETTNTGGRVALGPWVTPSTVAVAANYEVFATLVGGTLSTGTTGSWLALSTTRTWSRTRSVSGVSEGQIWIDIRLVGTTTVLDSAIITLTAERT